MGHSTRRMNVEHDEPQAPVADPAAAASEATGEGLATATPSDSNEQQVVAVTTAVLVPSPPPSNEPAASAPAQNVALEAVQAQATEAPIADIPSEPAPVQNVIVADASAPFPLIAEETGGPLPPEEPLPSTPTTPEPAPPPEPPEAPPLPDFPRMRHHPVAPAMIAIDKIDDDATFQIREEGDLSLLATDIARLGQLFPVDVRLKPPDRFQIICGFRRVAALRFLQRDRVLARLHTNLSDEDALLMALVSAIHARPVEPHELETVKARLKSQGRLSPSIRSMLEKALQPEDDLAPETVGDQEVDADELAQDVTVRLGELNQDLSLLAEAFDSLDRVRQDQLLEQLRYSSELVTYLEGRR